MTCLAESEACDAKGEWAGHDQCPASVSHEGQVFECTRNKQHNPPHINGRQRTKDIRAVWIDD